MSLWLVMLVAQAGPEPVAFSPYARMAASVYSSPARLVGGSGGAVGVELRRDALLAQADVGLLMGLGTVFEARAAVGWQRQGVYRPALLGFVSLWAGSQTTFLNDHHPLGVRGPAFAVGLELAPLRFVYGGWHLTALQLGVGVGSDFPEAGLALRATFFQLGVE